MKNLIKNNIKILLIILAFASVSFAKEWTKIVNLEGYWNFTIGDDLKWADPNYDDSDWERIGVPSSWEAEGFHGYNGYAWYRTTFELPKDASGYSLRINLGYIDDVDEVFLNGKKIGKSGEFPPNYFTAYNAYRSYPIPPGIITEGTNYIAVRVFDAELDGGILRGDIGIFAYTNGMKLSVNLEGEWKFRTGDSPEWKDPNYDDSNWNQIFVPGTWEVRGWPNYDGIAWYRLTFKVPRNFDADKAVFVLGKIDDVDEAFLNGTKIGSTGDFYSAVHNRNFGEEWAQFRGYYIPRGILKPGEENTIAVRVYDGFQYGGIYEGPIGLVTQDKYREYWRNRKEKKNIWDLIFGN